MLPFHCKKCNLGFHLELDKAEHENKCTNDYLGIKPFDLMEETDCWGYQGS